MNLTRAQKILIIIAILLTAVGIIFWLIFRRGVVPVAPPATPPVAVIPGVGLPVAGPAVPVGSVPLSLEKPPEGPVVIPPATQAVVVQQVTSAHLGGNGQLLFYKSSDGYFYRLSPGGTPEKISAESFKGAQTIVWSETKDQAVVTFPDGANVLHDFSTGNRTVLPKTWREFSFSPIGDQFAFKIINDNPDKQWLAKAKTDGSEIVVFQPLGRNADKVTVNWSPTGQIAGWFTQPKDLKRHEVFFLGFQGENLRSMLIEGYNPLGKWSPSGGRLLYSVVDLGTSGYPPTLWIVEASGDNIGRGRLQLPVQTWADKCIFAGETTVYCAVPRTLSSGAGFEREKAVGGDDLYRIDLTTGLKSPLAILGNRRHVAKDLFLSQDGQILYFVDKNNGNLIQVSTVLP